MEIFYEKFVHDTCYTISCLDVEVPKLVVPYHYHPETEIIYVEKGSGTMFVGDHSESFREGDVGMIGPNLPHVWKSDPVYKQNIPGLTTHVYVIHFHDPIFTGSLSVLPEMEGISKLIQESHLGIRFHGNNAWDLGEMIKQVVVSSGVNKLTGLLSLLNKMSETPERYLLCSHGFAKIRNSADIDRFDKAYKFMIDNFQNEIDLNMVASLIGMTPTSFCRYFKKHTTKSFHTVLNEIRIGHACKLLIENRMNISGICRESGFNNISNFNEQFKKLKGLTPGQFMRHRHSQ